MLATYFSVKQFAAASSLRFGNGAKRGRLKFCIVQAYMEARNLVVHHYREDVGRRMTFQEAFQRARADEDLLLEVWGFLDGWGIINCLAPAQAPTAAGDGAEGGILMDSSPVCEARYAKGTGST